jgi:hypothetical protein
MIVTKERIWRQLQPGGSQESPASDPGPTPPTPDKSLAAFALPWFSPPQLLYPIDQTALFSAFVFCSMPKSETPLQNIDGSSNFIKLYYEEIFCKFNFNAILDQKFRFGKLEFQNN